MPSCFLTPICTTTIGRCRKREPVSNGSQDQLAQDRRSFSGISQPADRLTPSHPDNGFYAPIYMLNDDALLNIFYIHSLDIAKTYDDLPPWPKWNRACWWYKCAQVCQRWRYLILASPAHLDLHLICTYGTPVADMLAHSPPLPLIINLMDAAREASAEDQKAILLVLQLRDRVRRIGLSMPVANLLKPIAAMDGQYPVLDRLFIWPPGEANPGLTLPTNFQAPRLRMLSLSYITLPMRHGPLATTAGLVSLELWKLPQLAYFHRGDLVASLSSMPQLESLSIGFKSPRFIIDSEGQLLQTTNGTHVALPSLRVFYFQGVGAYLEGLLALVSAPLLKTLRISLFNQLPFPFPHLSKFINTIENLRFSFAWLFFRRKTVILTTCLHEGDKAARFDVAIGCTRLELQVPTVMQILNCLMPRLSVVKRLALSHEKHDVSSGWHSEANRTRWRELLRPFSGVKVLHVAGGLIRQVSRSLEFEDGEPPPQLLPELKKLIYYKEGDPSDAFTSFIESRKIAGSSITLTQKPPSPSSLL
ncbi:hypothetical protein BC826DRAFT_1162011 [Russula brevipes]|nr:hypothetical protein BC826DRAFT_1162011 [Russula brevipes]